VPAKIPAGAHVVENNVVGYIISSHLLFFLKQLSNATAYEVHTHMHHHHHHHLFAQYAEMDSKICNVPDGKANGFSSNNCP